MLAGLLVIASAATVSATSTTIDGVEIVLAKRSTEIAASPFASLCSSEVHGEDEDAGVIETMAALGVKHVVMHNIHGSVGDPADRRLNAWLDGCAREGIEVRCILHSTDLDLWRKALVNYGDRIRNWSYLNEPNAPNADNDHTKPVVRPEDYVRGALQVRRIMREVRPECRLWGPEQAMLQHIEEWPWPWVRLALEAGLLSAIDGYSFHPYRQGYSPVNTPEGPSTFEGRATDRYATYQEQVATLRDMIRHKPLAVYEVGWSTTPEGPISEQTQAKFALRQQIQDFRLGIECAVWFMIRERHEDAPFPKGHPENHYGIVHTDNSPKPAYTALQTLYAQLDDRCLVSSAKVSANRPDVHLEAFDDPSGPAPLRKVFYWQPIPASDTRPVETVSLSVGEAKANDLPLSDAPRLLILRERDGAWAPLALVDLMGQSARAL